MRHTAPNPGQAGLQPAKGQAPALPALFLNEGVVTISRDQAVLGPRVFRIADVQSCRIVEVTEQTQRQGNVLFLNLCIAAALYFYVPIVIGYWQPKFYLAVVLFSLLALAALDDIFRSNGLVAFRLLVTTADGEQVAHVTMDRLLAARLETALTAAIAANASPSAAQAVHPRNLTVAANARAPYHGGHERQDTLRTEPDRAPAYRQHPHRPAQLAARAPVGRPVPAAAGRHRS
jgi:Family of unknown function (DUF6232)